MAAEVEYKPIPYLYRSRGLIARQELDRAPEYTYIQLMNTLERDEESMSSRFGTQIINRDATGAGITNYYFSAPVTSISRLNYKSDAWRYAGLGDGTLWRRAGNTQGAYTQIYSGLSGNTFNAQVGNVFQTSIPFLFIYDQSASIKDQGTGNPQLTGIDPPAYTANSVPYSPLLTIIDDFKSTNTYGGTVPSGWAFGSITTIPAANGQIVTDFPEFVNISNTVYSGGTANAGGNNTVVNFLLVNSAQTAGFPSVAVAPGESITVTVTGHADVTYTGGALGGYGTLELQYSTDGGTTWITFYTFTASTTTSFLNVSPSFSLAGLSNINQVLLRVQSSSIFTAGVGAVNTDGFIDASSATINASGIFGLICNGMLSILGPQTIATVPIASVVSSDLVAGAYTTLTIKTSTPHSLLGNPMVSVYGSSNDLVDGFYIATILDPTTLTVPFYSVNQIGATGGILYGGAPAPEICVLTNEYSTPYPTQFSAWGFYEQVPTSTTAFPVSAWSGTVASNSTADVSKTVNLDLSINNQATDDDLIVITLKIGSPNNVSNIRLQFDVNGSGYTSAYYYKDIAPAYYQANIANLESSYQATQQQIFADTLNLITGQPPGTTSAQLQPGNFSTGAGAWTAIFLRRGDFLPVGQAGQSGLDWTNITGWDLIITTADTGSSTVAVNGIYFQWGYGPSSFGGVGYDYRYTYYNAFTGTESSPSPQQFFGGLQYGYLSSQVAPIYLRQAVQVTGYYSNDPQVTHVRQYRRGGSLSEDWVQIDQIPNLTGAGAFQYKDTIPDAFVVQAQPLVLDNDPPVTSSLSTPIQTVLKTATSSPGNTIYSTFAPQLVTVADATAVFVPNQLVIVGTASNLEVVTVIAGGTGSFSAIIRLQHNQGEQVVVYAVPRQPCNLCALAYDQMWVAGDVNNPHYLYYSKKGLLENFGPQNYIRVSAPDDPINAVINWRGTLIVGTLKSWYIIVGGASPYPQPTGSVHGIVAQNGWVQVEGAIWYRAADGLREFTGADGVYKTLPIEWIYRLNPECLPPQADPNQASQDVMVYYNNQVITSYVSLNNGGQRYRTVWDVNYQRYRQDDIQATAMFWEKDINTLLVGKQIGVGKYAVVQDQVGDYDDGGYSGGALIKTPITITIQSPYRDIGHPHNPKQWNMLENDSNTQNQVLTTTLLFDNGTPALVLAPINTGLTRKKTQLKVNDGKGQQAYRESILHTMAVTVAPILYQEDMYVAVLADYNASFDSYWQKFGLDESKFVKEAYFDYTSTQDITVSLYADNSDDFYYRFTLPAQTQRYVMRVRFGHKCPGTTAFTMRTWRMIATIADTTNPFQMWSAVRVAYKPIGAGHTYQIKEIST